MTYLRSRLADALMECLDGCGVDIVTPEVDVPRNLVDVLLSLPGIGIVELEAVDPVAKAIFANRRHHEPVHAWDDLYSDEQDSYLAMARAALLAAANAAETAS